MNEKLAELLDWQMTRRTWLRGTVAVAGTAVIASGADLGRVFAQGLSDVDILQFALTLEHLEARMYKEMLATGILTGKEKAYFENFGAAEAAHVVAITQTLQSLGQTPVAAKATYQFPSFGNRGDILNFAKVAEDIGVGAYQGAAAAIKNKDVLAAAGSIVQVEARHAAIVNLLIGTDPVPDAFTKSQTVDEVLGKVTPILGPA